MTLWLDNQLPPALAAWMRATFSIECLPVRDLNLQRASDPETFTAARRANVVVMTKDADFVEILFVRCRIFRSIRPKGPLDRREEIEGAALEGLVA